MNNYQYGKWLVIIIGFDIINVNKKATNNIGLGIVMKKLKVEIHFWRMFFEI
jgi:hypothetical protein